MRGHRISVQLEGAAGRELILQYPSPDPLDARGHPTSPQSTNEGKRSWWPFRRSK
jgi:hypothetical protein